MNEMLRVDEYLKSRGKRSRKTAATYRSGINEWVKWAEENELDPMNTDTIVGFHSHLSEEKSASTTTTYMAGIVGYLEFLMMNGHAQNINLARIKYEVRNGPRPYSYKHVVELDALRKRDIPKLVKQFENYPVPEKNDSYNRRLSALRNVAIFWTLYETACRIGEARRLDRSHIARSRSIVVVTGKGGKPHTLRFGFPEHRAIPAILAYLKERTDRGNALFVSHSRNCNGKRMSITSLNRVIAEMMREAGVDDELTPHDIRHYRATTMLKQDVPLHVIQQFLNHQDIGTTRAFYAPLTEEVGMKRHLSRITA